jgi:CRISPR-associated protein Csb2
MLAIGIDFITGVAVMTDVASREKAEWPPHPARVFMALAAAHYESKPLEEDGPDATVEWQREREALEWLEAQGAPQMAWPEPSIRDVVKVYVPVNDAKVPPNPTGVKLSEIRSAIGVMPDQRSRQERTFPAVYVGCDGPRQSVYLSWPAVEPSRSVIASLHALTQKVTRIGHSSSLTQVWISQSETLPLPTHSPDAKAIKSRRGVQLRVPSAGFVAELDQCFNSDEIDAFFELSAAIAVGKGKTKEQAKADFEERFGMPWTKATPPLRQHPSTGRTAHYSPVGEVESPVVSSRFDPEILVLTKQEGPSLGLESTATLTAALRGLLLQDAAGKPEWFTGHTASGVPSTGGHMAIIPLSYVGGEHADGHIMGLALVFPRSVSAADRAACLRVPLFDALKDDRSLTLTLGNLGTWTLLPEERNLPPLALRGHTWSEASSVWASVTPIVLDRHPKHDRRTERQQWRDEVAASITQSCLHQDLPAPMLIDVDKTSWHRGAPRSQPGPGGMPWLPGKENSATRQQVHVLIQFPCEVEGPLLLGAGRYRGYGLCKPLGSPPK